MKTTSVVTKTLLALGCCAFFITAASLFADDAAKEPQKTERKEARGRLPAYYSDVVTGKQREEIYGIQKEYLSEIERLKAELRTVVKERDERVRAVLSAEQQAEVDKIAEKKRAERKQAAIQALEKTQPK